MESLLLDLRYAVRSLSRSPVASIAAVLCLGLGIGANTTMFGIVDRLLFRAPAYVRDPGRVMRVLLTRTYRGNPPVTGGIGAFPFYLDIADGAGVFDAVAAYRAQTVDLGRGRDAETITAGIVTHTFFPLLGVGPYVGHFFGSDEDRVGAAPVAVLSYEFWQRHFGGERGALGQSVVLAGTLYTVIGIAPRGFTGVDLAAVDLWVPAFVAAPRLVFPNALDSRGSFWCSAIARLKPGATVEQAAARTSIPMSAAATTANGYFGPPPTVALAPILAGRGPEATSDVKVATWVTGVAGIVLLIACANVANLLFARSAGRRREIAVRLALGAGRRRLVRQLLTEAVVLSVGGAVVAIAMAIWGGSLIRALILPSVPATDLVLDGRVLTFTALAALFTATLCGLAPALQASQPDLTGALKAGRNDLGTRRSRTRDFLLAAQVALTLVLLVGAGLFIRSLENVRGLEFGYDVDHVLTAYADLRRAGFDSVRTAAFYDEAVAKARAVPGVTSVALSAMPLGAGRAMSLSVPGMDSLPRSKGGGPYIDAVVPDYFSTVGRRIVSGRAFTSADADGAAPVLIISQTMARAYWRGASPLGACVTMGSGYGPCREIVGVVSDMRRYLSDDENFTIYLPLAQGARIGFPAGSISIRTSGRAGDVVAGVRRQLQSLAADLPYVRVATVSERIEPQFKSWRLGATMFGVFGGLALALASVGLYGVLAHLVTLRTSEVGVRMALGATRRDVLALIVGQGMRVVASGLAIGVVAALLGGKALGSLLYGVTPRDPAVMIVAAASLLLVAAVASYLPARRATRVDPSIALREE